MPSLDQIVKRLISRWPRSLQTSLRRLRYRWLIRSGQFRSDEPEFDRIAEWLSPGDWVVDVGANIGNYTIAFSGLVGSCGRVIALEPVPLTFGLLTQHARLSKARNVTLLNLAASDRTHVVTMQVPLFDSGLKNIYQARIGDGGDQPVLAVPLDALALNERVGLIKIDVEGHELRVLRGAMALIERDRPVLIIEGPLHRYASLLTPLDYRADRVDGSPNSVFLPTRSST